MPGSLWSFRHLAWIILFVVNAPVLAQAVAPKAAASSGRSDQATGLSYFIETWLTYVDRFAKPGAENRNAVVDLGADDLPLASAITGGPRTLGLTRARILLDWETGRSSRFSLVLRPDWQQHTADAASPTVHRDFDRRAGYPPYSPAPTVQLLDAYQLALLGGESFEAAIGVWESLTVSHAAYPQELEFGLAPRFPEKFSGARIIWRQESKDVSALASTGASGLVLSLYALQGREDRAELFKNNAESFDVAPAAQDPYYGGATGLSWFLPRGSELGILGGYGDHSVGASGGRRRELFGEIFAKHELPLVPEAGPLKIALEARYERDNFDGTEADAFQLVQQSVALTSSAPALPNLWVLLGGHFGRAQRPGTVEFPVQDLSGYQVDGGILWEFARHMNGIVSIANEHRETKRLDETGETIGGFVDGDHRKLNLQRIALEVRCQLGSD